MKNVQVAVPSAGLGSGRRERAFLLALVLAVTGARAARAAGGGPDSFGHEWIDDASGCAASVAAWGPAVQEHVDTPLGSMVGPVPLGFVMPFYGEPVTEAWISPHGFLSFSPQPSTNTLTTLPDPAAPNDFIAAHWIGAADAVRTATVRHEAGPGVFHVEWEQRVASTWDFTSTHLWLSEDGSYRIAWESFSDAYEVLVGYEDRTGARGRTLLQRASGGGLLARDGTFPEPAAGRSACVRPPPPVGVLDCDGASPLPCDAATAGASPGAGTGTVELYGCGTARWTGREAVFTLDLPVLSDLAIDLTAGGRAMAVFLLDACNEFRCLAGGGASLGASSLPPGSYVVVVDAADSSQEGPFTLDVACTALSTPLPCGSSSPGTTAAGPSRVDAWACLAGDFSGPEAYHELDFTPPGNIELTLASGTGQAVLVHDARLPVDGSTCLGGGVGGAVIFEPPAGRYVIAVDGPAGSAGSYELSLRCQPHLDCGDPTPIGCNDAVTGTTVGAPGLVEVYRCPAAPLSGPESVHVFDNPVQQVVSFVLDDSADPRLDVLLLDACNEGSCVAMDDAVVSADLAPGTYLVVVDGREGAAAPYVLSTVCGNGIEPDFLSIVGAAGECFTERKVAWLTPQIVRADVLLAIDLTGSMGAESAQLKANMQDLMERLGRVVGDLAVGLVSYQDYPFSGLVATPCPYDGSYAGPTDYPYLLEQSITTDPTVIRAAVDRMPVAHGGIDDPASYNRMMYEAAADPAIGWRPGARRLLVNFGDALPHDCNVLECLGGVSETNVKGIDLGRDGEPDTGDELATLDVVQALIDEEITLLHLDSSGGRSDAGFSFQEIWDCWAARTGGRAEVLNADGTVPGGLDLAEVVQELIREQGASCGVLELVASPGYEAWLVSASPVLVDEPLPTRRTFDIEVCVPLGTPEGRYDFEVQVVCSGGVVSVQRLQVQVVGDCQASVVVGPADATICRGESAELDASGMSLVNCSGTVEYRWSDGSSVVGTEATLTVSPSSTTTYEVTVSCSTDPSCEARDTADVVVHAAPVLEAATARDLADCNPGVEVSWPPALFLDESGSGVYNVYRSEVDCADALGRPPLALGVTGTAWLDATTVGGRTYHYVVEAEDARAPTACLPRGPANGGSVTRLCLPPVDEVAVRSEPDGVYATLRVEHEGAQLTVRWESARALVDGEHFHLHKALTQPDRPPGRVNPEGDLSRSYSETDSSVARQFFDLRVANACEQESADEYPPGYDVP